MRSCRLPSLLIVAACVVAGVAGCAAPRAPRSTAPLRPATVEETLARASERLAPRRLLVAPFVTDALTRPVQDLAEVLPDLLTERLALVSPLRVLPPELARVRTGRADDGSVVGLVTSTAPAIGSELSADFVLLGAVTELPDGAGVRATIRLADLTRGVISEAIEEQTSADDAAELAPRLTGRLVASLGLVMDSLTRRRALQPGDESPRARAALAAALRAHDAGAWPLARAQFAEAARLAPSLTLAAERARDLTQPFYGTPTASDAAGTQLPAVTSALAITFLNRPIGLIASPSRNIGSAADAAFPTTIGGLQIILIRP